MKSLNKTYEIKAAPEEMWQALTDPGFIEEWSGAPAVMDENAGTEFQLFGGDIHGFNREMERNEQIVQDWYAGDWKQPSKVTITLGMQRDFTLVELQHEGIPDDAFPEIDTGWDNQYLGRIQALFEEKLLDSDVSDEDMGQRFQDSTTKE